MVSRWIRPNRARSSGEEGKDAGALTLGPRQDSRAARLVPPQSDQHPPAPRSEEFDGARTAAVEIVHRFLVDPAGVLEDHVLDLRRTLGHEHTPSHRDEHHVEE
jgi:hypothetical protein